MDIHLELKALIETYQDEPRSGRTELELQWESVSSVSLATEILHEKGTELTPLWQRGLLHSMFFTSNIKEFV